MNLKKEKRKKQKLRKEPQTVEIKAARKNPQTVGKSIENELLRKNPQTVVKFFENELLLRWILKTARKKRNEYFVYSRAF